MRTSKAVIGSVQEPRQHPSSVGPGAFNQVFLKGNVKLAEGLVYIN